MISYSGVIRFLPPGEGRLAVRAAVLAVAGVQLDVAVPRPLVFEQPRAKLATERHLIRVRLKTTDGES